jgi:hypothetical protein
MPHSCWPCAVTFLFIVLLGLGIGRAIPLAFVLRFSDTLPTQDASQQATLAVLPVSEPDAPVAPANSWLMQHGWKQIWPLRLLGHPFQHVCFSCAKLSSRLRDHRALA